MASTKPKPKRAPSAKPRKPRDLHYIHGRRAYVNGCGSAVLNGASTPLQARAIADWLLRYADWREAADARAARRGTGK